MGKRAREDAVDPPLPTALRIRAELARFAALRAARGSTFCPSEVARAVARDWRPLMHAVRSVAAEMIAARLLEATQRGALVEGSILAARGPIRLRAPKPK